jgi:transposase
MPQVATIGLDLAKNVFQVHGVDGDGKVIIRRQLRRAEVNRLFTTLPPCLVGMEACASAHQWAREIAALGHAVKLMPPAYVKPYAKRGKTDAADAEAIAEAVTRPTMRFVAVKTIDQQAVLMLHKVRDLLSPRTRIATRRQCRRMRATTCFRNEVSGRHNSLLSICGTASGGTCKRALKQVEQTPKKMVPPEFKEQSPTSLAKFRRASERRSRSGLHVDAHRRHAFRQRSPSHLSLGPLR